MKRGFGALIVASLLAGCGPKPSQPAPPLVSLGAGAEAVPVEAGGGEEILLIGGSRRGAPDMTYHLAPEGKGRLVAEEPGVVIATKSGEMVWHTEVKAASVKGCDEDVTVEALEPGHVTHAFVASRDGQRRQEVVDPSTNGGNVDQIMHSVELLGVIGPYLFVHEASESSTCGRASLNAAFSIWDAEAGRAIELLDTVPDRDSLARKAEKILNEEDPRGWMAASEVPDLVQILPAYGPRGALWLEGQFARLVLPEQTDSRWASNTRSAFVGLGWMPARFSPWQMPAVAVKDFLALRPEVALIGWSRR